MSQTNAICVPGKDIPNSFNTYIQTCRSDNDISRSSNFFNQSVSTIKDKFQALRAQFDDLIQTGDSMAALMSLSQNTRSDVANRTTALKKQHDELLHSINEKRRISDSADKSFVEEIMHKTPHMELKPSIQDGALFLFWSGWLILALTLVYIRASSPGGGVGAGFFTFLLLTLLTVAVYGLLLRIA
jgi:hypothetical protein